MREAVARYMAEGESAALGSVEHLAPLILTVILIVGLPWAARRWFRQHTASTIGQTIGWTVFAVNLIWYVLELLGGTYRVQTHLPIDVCRINALLLPLIMTWRSVWAYRLLYFWAIPITLIALPLPDIRNPFPHFMYLRFWIVHGGVVLATIYATVVYRMRPRATDVIWSFAALNVLVVIALIVNALCDANYLYLTRFPGYLNVGAEGIASTPLSIYLTEAAALAGFGIAYLPIACIKRRRSLPPLAHVGERPGEGED